MTVVEIHHENYKSVGRQCPPQGVLYSHIKHGKLEEIVFIFARLTAVINCGG